MELEWEQGRRSPHTAAALAGAFLGAALGADCFLAADYLIGGIPALLCGAAIAFWAVKGGVLFADRNSQAVVLLALFPTLLWGIFVNHLSFALTAAPGDPAGIQQAFLSPLFITGGAGYWFQLAGLSAASLGSWTTLSREVKKEQEFLKRAARPCQAPQEAPPADLELYLPKHAWIRPWLLQRRITQGLWLTVLFLLVWLPDLLGHEQVLFRALCGMGASFLVIASLPGPSRHILAARKVMYARKDGQLWLIAMQRIQDTVLHVRLSKLAQIWDRLPQSQRTRFKASIACGLLGMLYFHGLGNPQDYGRAVYYLERKQSDSYNDLLGLCYLLGYGCQQDVQRGRELLERGRDGRIRDYGLGMMYAEGLGIRENIGKGVEYLEKAAGAGYEPAKEAMTHYKKSWFGVWRRK